MKRDNPRDYRPIHDVRYDFTLTQISYQGENERNPKPHVTIRAVIDNGPIKGKVLSHRFTMKLDDRRGEKDWRKFEKATGVRADRELQKSACLQPFRDVVNELRFSAVVKVTEHIIYEGEWFEVGTLDADTVVATYDARVQKYELVRFDTPELQRELKIRKSFPRWKDHV